MTATDAGMSQRFTVREYEQLIAAGRFVGRARVELLDGTIAIQSPLHKRAEPMNASHDDQLPAGGYGTMIEIKIPYRNNSNQNKNGYDY